METLTSVLLLLVFSRAVGQIFKRLLNTPEVVGEIIAGLLLGPAVFDWIQPTAEIKGISQLAIFLVIFYAGLELEIHEIFTAMRGAGLPIAILGFATPLLAGIVLGKLFAFSLFSSAVIGLCLAITALPVALRFLESLELMGTRLGHHVIGAAIIIDIAALFGLGFILDAPKNGSIEVVFNSLISNGSKLALFFALILSINWFLTKKLKKRYFQVWLKQLTLRFGEESLFGVAVLIVLVFSSITETIGFHFVIGAFFGGMLLSRDFLGKELYQNIQKTLNSVTGGFLAPLFFAYVGLLFSPAAFQQPLLLAAILIFGMASKTIGAYFGGKLAGISGKECFAVGVILNGRGVMDLVVADIALEQHFITKGVFSALVMLSIVSTSFTPVVYRRIKLQLSELIRI